MSARLLKSFKGFTLIELLITITIIAILATIGASVYTQTQKTARDAKRKGDVEEIAKALEQYYFSNNNQYPATLATMTAATYFQNGALPTTPAGTAAYQYTMCPAVAPFTAFVVCTDLENQTNGITAALPAAGAQAAAVCAPVAPVAGSRYYCVYSSNR